MGKISSIWKGLRLTLKSLDVQHYGGNPVKLSSSNVRTNSICLISSDSSNILHTYLFFLLDKAQVQRIVGGGKLLAESEFYVAIRSERLLFMQEKGKESFIKSKLR